jgi:hemolysin activation/secretion protein
MRKELAAHIGPFRAHRFHLLAAVSVICIELSIHSALAQVFNPTVLAPSAPPPSRGVRSGAPSASGLDMPPNADKTFVIIRHVKLDGAFPEMEAENAAFIAKLQGQRVSVAQLFVATRELQLAYSKAYALAQISVPPQDFKSGNIRITVTDGYIQSLDLSKVPEDVRELVRPRLQPLVGKRHLTTGEYQRQTILIGYLPGVTGQAGTRPGSIAEESILAVEVNENHVTTSLVVDNRLPKEFGTWSFSNSTALNNALGFG